MGVLQKTRIIRRIDEAVDAGGMNGDVNVTVAVRAGCGDSLRYRRQVVHGSTPSRESAATRFRASLAAADRLRRARDRRRRAWRGAPYVAALSLCIGLLGEIREWSAVLPLTLLGAGLSILTVYACLTRRGRAVSDPLAAAIDRDAGLDGELRSANWFAARETRDGWADFHLDRAADRIASLDWARIYPSLTDRRAKLATGGIALATLLLPLALPGLSRVLPFKSEARHADRIALKAPLVPGLPGEFSKELETLLTAAENGTLRVETPAQAAALRDLLDRLTQLHGADSLKQLARAMAPATDAAQQPSTEAVLNALAKRVDRAAQNAALPPRVRDALDTLADELSQAAQVEGAANRDPRDAMPAGSPQDADAVQTNASANADEMSIQLVRDADTGGGAAVLMVANPNANGTDPGTGLGGGSAAQAQQGRMADIAQALRRETVEANANAEGADPLTDLRRKSERGRASVSFTRSAVPALDQGSSSRPPTIPEARRAAIQTYFARKQ
jgi:hypothetical protein